MNELLTLIIDLVKELPEMAIWVLVILFGYKVIVIGTGFAVVKLAIVKIHDAIISRQNSPRTIVHRWDIEDISCMCKPELLTQLSRLTASTGLIHGGGITKLKAALDEYEKTHGGLS